MSMNIKTLVLVALASALALGTAAGQTVGSGSGTAGAPYAFTYERIQIPMRDGVLLSADVYRPVVPAGQLVPVIVTITPYHVLYKALDRTETDLPDDTGSLPKKYVPLGYAYSRVDVRGTYGSGGCWDYGGLNERHDGYDVVEWFGTRSWSNGKIAMIGASYDGTTANAAAVEAPPHLATIVPISSISRWYGYAYQQGTRATYSGESADSDPPGDTPTDFMLAYGGTPPLDPSAASNADQVAMRWTLCPRVSETLHGYATQPDYDAFWQERDYLRRADQVRVPVLVAHGFIDFNVKTWEGTAWYQALRVPKVLVAGQWPHALPAYGGWTKLLQRWFERWLLEIPNGVENEAPVHVQGNTGGFRDQVSWGAGPLQSFPLSGGARSYTDDGALTESEMLRGLTPDRYVRIPVAGTTGLRIEGRPILHLAATSNSPGTHFSAILCDTGAAGTCDVISRAFMNARYRGGLETGVDVVPGLQSTYDLEFIDKDYVLAADHHLELILSSSSATWIASDEHRALNTLSLNDSRLDLPLR